LILPLLALMTPPGCDAVEPTIIRDAACGCELTLPLGVRQSEDLHPEAELMAMSAVSEVYLIVLTEPKDEFEPLGLAGYYELVVGYMIATGAQPTVELEETTVDGLPAIRQQLLGTIDDAEIVYEVLLVDAPQSFYQIVSWSLRSRYDGNKADMVDMLRSFRVTDPAQREGETRWYSVDYPPATEPLAEARAAFTTQLREPPTPTPTDAAPAPPEGMYELVEYPAPLGDQVGYLTPDPGDGERHPAVLWAHGGFGGVGEWLFELEPDPGNDQTARAFREAGLVTFIPSWRGENDNPGQLELFYGEVDDLLAARDHLAGLPYVDPERIYLAGHSTGGTLVLLAAAMDARFRAGFVFGGMPDISSFVADGEGYGNTPFDHRRVDEGRLRSAVYFAGGITRPVFYFEGQEGVSHSMIRGMAEVATAAKAPLTVHWLAGRSHFDILAPLTTLAAEKILADTGSSVAITFTDPELEAALR